MSTSAFQAGVCAQRPPAILGLLLALLASAASAAEQRASGTFPDTFQVRFFTTEDGLPAHMVSGIAQAPDGHLWVSTMGGLVRFDGREFRVLDARAAGLPGNRVTILGHDPPGRLWLSFDLGTGKDPRFGYLEGTSFHPAAPEEASRFLDRKPPAVAFPLPPGWESRLVDRSERVWATTESGALACFREGRKEPLWTLDRSLGQVLALFEDSGGDLWVGSSRSGLIQILRPLVESVPGVRGAVGPPVEAPDGTIAVRAVAAEPTCWRIGPAGVTREACVERREFLDSRGRRWFPLRTGEDWFVAVERSGTRLLTLPTASPPSCREQGCALAFAEDPREPGTVWLADLDGVRRIDPDRPSPEAVRESHPVPAVRQIVTDRAGIVWAVSDAGLTRFEGGVGRTFTTADGLPTNEARALHLDGDGFLWIGTYGGGLVRFDGNGFATIDHGRGLADDVVAGILEDDAGYFWMAGNRGIHRASRPEILEVLAGRLETLDAAIYTRDSGLVNPETSGAHPIRARDGRMWFPTMDGLAVVEPSRVLVDSAGPTEVRIETRRSTRDPWTPVGETHAIAPGDDRRLSVRFTSIDLREGRTVHYHYRLEGLDDAWRESGSAGEVAYDYVPPGEYTLRVRAARDSGGWSEEDAVLRIRVEPRFRETAWMVVLPLLLLGAALWIGHAVRVRGLRRSAALLDRTVEERTRALNELKTRAEALAGQLAEADRRKTKFFEDLSHELRSPLTLIEGPLLDLLDDRGGRLEPEARAQVALALRNSRRLLSLVEQLLELARVASGDIAAKARRIELPSFLGTLVEGFGARARAKEVELRLEVEGAIPHVWFDVDHLEKIVGNLIGNALKFTPVGSAVTLRAHTAAGAERPVIVEVEDEGSGIPPDEIGRIFDRFFRGSTADPWATSGTGLGLALSRELVERHGGTIEAANRAEGGARFTLRLRAGREHLPRYDVTVSGEDWVAPEPVTIPSAEPPTAEGPAPAVPAREAPEDAPTVLIVDDEPQVRAYLRSQLRTQYRVVEAEDGATGLEEARRTVPDVVVSDVVMPRMDGLALCRAVKGDPELEFIPVILLTAKDMHEDRMEGLEAGADEYVAKPFHVRELERRIANLIETRRRLRKRLRQEDLPQVEIPRVPGGPGGDPAAAELLERIRSVVEEHVGNDEFDASVLARELGMSRATLYRRLHGVLHQSPMDLIRRMRLDHASRLLISDRGSVSEIAYAVGFKSVSRFSTAFREQFGMSPTEFRNSFKKAGPPKA